MAIPAMIALVVFAVARTKWPMKQIALPPTKNHRRPKRSVFAPLLMVSYMEPIKWI